jgi:ankyrin repeat protein
MKPTKKIQLLEDKLNVEVLVKDAKRLGINFQDPKNGYSLLHIAVIRNLPEAVTEMVKMGIDKDLQNKDGATALHLAALKGKTDIVRLLVAAGADINKQTIEGATALHIAAQGQEITARGGKLVHKDETDSVRCLVEAGADINKKADQGFAALHLAAQNGNHGCVSVLVGAPKIEKNIVNDDGDAPLHLAAKNGHQQVVMALLKAQTDKNIIRIDKFKPFHIAAENGHVAVMEILFNKKDDNIDEPSYLGFTALHLAAQNGYEGAVTWLLDNKANIDAITAEGATALHIAIQYNHLEIVKILVQRGADKEMMVQGSSPFHLAAQNGCHEIVEFLLNNGVDKDTSNAQGLTALHFAALRCNVEMVRIILQKWVDINKQTEFGLTAEELIGGYNPERAPATQKLFDDYKKAIAIKNQITEELAKRGKSDDVEIALERAEQKGEKTFVIKIARKKDENTAKPKKKEEKSKKTKSVIIKLSEFESSNIGEQEKALALQSLSELFPESTQSQPSAPLQLTKEPKSHLPPNIEEQEKEHKKQEYCEQIRRTILTLEKKFDDSRIATHSSPTEIQEEIKKFLSTQFLNAKHQNFKHYVGKLYKIAQKNPPSHLELTQQFFTFKSSISTYLKEMERDVAVNPIKFKKLSQEELVATQTRFDEFTAFKDAVRIFFEKGEALILIQQELAFGQIRQSFEDSSSYSISQLSELSAQLSVLQRTLDASKKLQTPSTQLQQAEARLVLFMPKQNIEDIKKCLEKENLLKYDDKNLKTINTLFRALLDGKEDREKSNIKKQFLTCALTTLSNATNYLQRQAEIKAIKIIIGSNIALEEVGPLLSGIAEEVDQNNLYGGMESLKETLPSAQTRSFVEKLNSRTSKKEAVKEYLGKFPDDKYDKLKSHVLHGRQAENSVLQKLTTNESVLSNNCFTTASELRELGIEVEEELLGCVTKTLLDNFWFKESGSGSHFDIKLPAMFPNKETYQLLSDEQKTSYIEKYKKRWTDLKEHTKDRAAVI